LFCVFLTCSWVTADLTAGIFHIYAGNRLRADDSYVFAGFKQTVIYGANIQFWPTLGIRYQGGSVSLLMWGVFCLHAKFSPLLFAQQFNTAQNSPTPASHGAMSFARLLMETLPVCLNSQNIPSMVQTYVPIAPKLLKETIDANPKTVYARNTA